MVKDLLQLTSVPAPTLRVFVRHTKSQSSYKAQISKRNPFLSSLNFNTRGANKRSSKKVYSDILLEIHFCLCVTNVPKCLCERVYLLFVCVFVFMTSYAGVYKYILYVRVTLCLIFFVILYTHMLVCVSLCWYVCVC